MYFLKNIGKTVFAQATTTRHELRKLLQVPVGVSEGLLHGDSTAQGDEWHTESSKSGSRDYLRTLAMVPFDSPSNAILSYSSSAVDTVSTDVVRRAVPLP